MGVELKSQCTPLFRGNTPFHPINIELRYTDWVSSVNEDGGTGTSPTGVTGLLVGWDETATENE